MAEGGRGVENGGMGEKDSPSFENVTKIKFHGLVNKKIGNVTILNNLLVEN
jgi:hypothetical protein